MNVAQYSCSDSELQSQKVGQEVHRKESCPVLDRCPTPPGNEEWRIKQQHANSQGRLTKNSEVEF